MKERWGEREIFSLSSFPSALCHLLGKGSRSFVTPAVSSAGRHHTHTTEKEAMRVPVIVSGPLDSSMKPQMQETRPKQTMLKVKKDLGQRDLEACLVKGIELGQRDDAVMDSFDVSESPF